MIKVDGDALIFIAGFAADSRAGSLSHSIYNIKVMLKLMKESTNDNEYIVGLSSTNKDDNFRYKLLPKYKGNRFKRCETCIAGELLKLDIETLGIRQATRQAIELYKPQMNFSETTHIKVVDDFKRRYYTCLNCGSDVPSLKPTYFKKMRQYLLEYQGAEIVKGECDDWLLVGEPDYVATHDKDIYQGTIPIYNLKHNTITDCYDLGNLHLIETPVKGQDGKAITNKRDGKVRVTKELKGVGYKWFCALLLLGDVADNIPKPVNGDGPVAISDILNPATTASDCWNRVVTYYNNAKCSDILERNAQLFWVSREYNQRWSKEFNDDLIKRIDCEKSKVKAPW